MILLKVLILSNKVQYKVLVALISVYIGFTGILSCSNNSIFERLFGRLHPLLIAFAIGFFGFFSLSFLLSKNWFVIYKKSNLRAFLHYSELVLVFVSVAVFVDCTIIYPRDMNILFPDSLLFYPAIAFLVEILFHIIPLTLVFLIFSSIFKTIPFQKLLWVILVIIAIIEPTYQIYVDTYPYWALAVVWINLFLFNLLQLIAFQRHGFVFMYALRMLYYLFWHVIWGEFRLELLHPF